MTLRHSWGAWSAPASAVVVCALVLVPTTVVRPLVVLHIQATEQVGHTLRIFRLRLERRVVRAEADHRRVAVQFATDDLAALAEGLANGRLRNGRLQPEEADCSIKACRTRRDLLDLEDRRADRGSVNVRHDLPSIMVRIGWS